MRGKDYLIIFYCFDQYPCYHYV